MFFGKDIMKRFLGLQLWHWSKYAELSCKVKWQTDYRLV